MATERFVVAGLAHVRSGWFRDLGRWASAAMIPVDFLKCISPEEVRVRLGAGRAISALIVDSSMAGFDRDLVDEARDAGCAVIVVDDRRRGRNWIDVGASAMLPEGFGRTELIDVLHQHATPIGEVDVLPPPGSDEDPIGWRGRLIAVTGPGGTGTSTLAIALAQGLAADPRQTGLVALADLALDADLAMLHDATDVIPGLQELVESHRGSTPDADEVLGMTFDDRVRGYRLLLGLRRHRDWTALRPRAFEAALSSLLAAHRTVVADTDDDVEGEAETGSVDVEDRNLMARTTLGHADLVLVVGAPGLSGVHRLVRACHRLRAAGLEASRIVPVINQSPRGARPRAQLTSTVAELLAAPHPNAIHVGERRSIEDALRDGVRLPSTVVDPLTRGVQAILATLQPRSGSQSTMAPIPILPGELGHWSEAAG